MKVRYHAAVAVLMAVGLVVAWSPTGPLFGLAAPATEAAKRGGTLNLFSTQTVGRIDPIATQLNYIQVISYNLFGQLVQYKTGTWEVIPDLAERWDVSGDGLAYTFRMRRGLKFHDGSPIQLSDVVFSLERTFRNQTSVYEEQFRAVKSITPDINRNSVVVTLSQPDPFLLAKMAGIGGSAIVPWAVARKYGDQFATIVENTIGSGPFRLVEKSQTRLVWERFSDFYAPAYVDRVVMRIIPDARTQQLEFDAGKVDWMGSILDVDQARGFRRDPKFAKHYKEFLAPARNWFGLNIARKPFDDLRVRQALAMAIDPQAMAEIGGLARASNTLMHPQLPGYNPGPPAYPKDPTRAKALLQEAGLGGGLRTNFYIYNNARYIAQAELMQQQLAEVGVQIEIRVAEFGTHMNEVRKKTFPFFFTLANLLYPDPAALIYGSFHSDGPFNPGYENKDVDRLLDQAINVTNVERRARLAADAEQIVRREAAVIYVWDRTAGHVFQPWIHGVEDVIAIYPRVRMNEVWINPSRR